MEPRNAAGSEQYSQGGYEASFGTYVIEESTHTFTFHVEGALVRTLIGKDLLRAFELSGQQLIVKSTRPEEHWKVVWERYQATLGTHCQEPGIPNTMKQTSGRSQRKDS
jgi:hypothetical protein